MTGFHNLIDYLEGTLKAHILPDRQYVLPKDAENSIDTPIWLVRSRVIHILTLYLPVENVLSKTGMGYLLLIYFYIYFFKLIFKVMTNQTSKTEILQTPSAIEVNLGQGVE